jgi:hypothetical protein
MRTFLRLLAYPVVFGLAFLYLGTAQAVVIEGVTPSGKFKSVFVTEAGRLPIEVSTGSVSHVIVDSGTITSYQGGTWNVGTAVGVSVTVNASTSATTVNSQVSVTAIQSTCYPADPLRKQGVFCNASDSINIYIGAVGVTPLSGAILGPGSCYSPDVPTAYIGSLTCVSTAPVTGFYIYGK